MRERNKLAGKARNKPELGLSKGEPPGSSQRPLPTALLPLLRRAGCPPRGSAVVCFCALWFGLLLIFFLWLAVDRSGAVEEVHGMHRPAPHTPLRERNGSRIMEGGEHHVTLVMPTSGDTLELVRQSLAHTSPLVRALCASNSTFSFTSMVNIVLVQLVALRGSLRPSLKELDARHEADVAVRDCVWSHWRFHVPVPERPTPDAAVAFCRISEVRLLLPKAAAGETYARCGKENVYGLVTPEEWLYDAAVRAGLKASGVQTPYFAVLAESLMPLGVLKNDAEAHEFEKEAGEGGFMQRLMSPLRHNNGRVAAVQCTIIAGNTAQSHFEAAMNFTEERVQGLRGYEVLDRGVRGAFGSTSGTAVTRFFLTQTMRGRDARDARVRGWEEPLDGVSPFCALWHRDLFDEAGGFVPSCGSGLLGPMEAAAPSHMGWALSFRIAKAQPDWEFWSSTALAVAWRGLGLQCGAARPAAEGCSVAALVGATRPSYALTPLQQHRWGAFLTERIRRRVVRGSWQPVKYNAPAFSGVEAVEAVSEELAHVTVYGMYCRIPCSGMMMEMVHYLTPLQSWGVPISMSASRCSWCDALPEYILDGLLRTHWQEEGASRPRVPRMQRVALFHGAPRLGMGYFGGMKPNRAYAVGRIITEMSCLSSTEVDLIHQNLDEVWVPSAFFQSVYERSGVRRGMIRVIPESIDPFVFDPSLYEPVGASFLSSLLSAQRTGVWSNRPLRGGAWKAGQRQSWNMSKRRFRFLSIFKWEQRKGWDVLLKAYWKAFGPGQPHHDDVELYIKCSFPANYAGGVNYRSFPSYINSWVRQQAEMGGAIGDFPPIVMIGDGTLSQEAILSMYRSVDAFVLPTRAEGWGLPLMEAMSMGLPVLVTNWGGPTAFCRRDNSFLIPVDGLEELPKWSAYGYLPGKKCAIPSVTGLTQLMRYVFENPALAREVGRRARQSVLANYTEEAVATQVLRRLREISHMLLVRQHYAFSEFVLS
ncbi:putative mannosyltransferase-like protein [Trypanosoma conorhini]|uniref:Putative mannosyltransferase-like protein n=1 Tax=Trypanosoma conorhini TaxID=83891 RepID=A0A422N942_9TRYP|nr:putative mannosyltransferase-like protein [Trypanosoma conorhini]RNF01980.1 putative mannosyltransferase-like protein [Trypanosoma conorhini]